MKRLEHSFIAGFPRLIWLDAKGIGFLRSLVHSPQSSTRLLSTQAPPPSTPHTAHNVDNHAHPSEPPQNRHQRIRPPNAIHWGYQSWHLHRNGQIRQQILRELRTRATLSVSPPGHPSPSPPKATNGILADCSAISTNKMGRLQAKRIRPCTD